MKNYKRMDSYDYFKSGSVGNFFNLPSKIRVVLK